jgi:hypothetical protein
MIFKDDSWLLLKIKPVVIMPAKSTFQLPFPNKQNGLLQAGHCQPLPFLAKRKKNTARVFKQHLLVGGSKQDENQ